MCVCDMIYCPAPDGQRASGADEKGQAIANLKETTQSGACKFEAGREQ